MIFSRCLTRTQTTVAVGEHREEQVEETKPGYYAETREDRVGLHAAEAKGETHRDQDHRFDDIHLRASSLLLYRRHCAARSVRLVLPHLPLLTTNHQQDFPVPEDKDEQRPHVDDDEPRYAPRLSNPLSRVVGLSVLVASAADNFCRSRCRYEVGKEAEDPRNDDSGACHPWTIAVAVGNRVDDLDVAFNGDDHEAANRGVASSDGYGVSAEEPAYEQRQGRVQLRVVYTFQYETEKEKSTGGKVEDGLVGDENVDVARARVLAE